MMSKDKIRRPRIWGVCLGALAILSSACGNTATSGSSTTSVVSGSSKLSSNSLSLKAQAKVVFPNGVTLVSSQPPGGLMYIASEALQPSLQEVLGVPVTIRQVPGGGGKVAAEYLYKSAPTSPTILPLLIPNYAIAQVVSGAGKFNLDRFTPLGGMYGNDTSIFVAKRGSSLKNFSSLSQSTSTLTVGVAGFKSSAGWFSATVLAKADHVNLKSIPFTTGSQAVNALLSGAIDLASITRALALPLLSSQKVQAVLEFAPKPLSYLPGTESIAQAGYPNESFYNLIGVVGPPGMSKKASGILAEGLAAVAQESTFIAKAKELHLEPTYSTAQQWGKEMASQVQLIKSRVSLLGVG